jgi:hypothetical protein
MPNTIGQVNHRALQSVSGKKRARGSWLEKSISSNTAM